MRKPVVLVATAVATLFGASNAAAQWAQPLGGKLTVGVYGILQPGSGDITRTSTFTLYDEPAEVTTVQDIDGGGAFEIGGTYRVRGDFGVGVAYSFLTSEEGGTINGSLPHPLFFDQPRTFTTGLQPMEHKESAIHLQAVWFMPFVDKVDFAFTAGPSIFNVTQGLARGVSFSEQPPDFAAVTIDNVDVATLEETTVGFNIGAEATYAVLNNVGVGAMLRYTRGNAEFEIAPGETADVKAGNIQLGFGVRFKF